MADTMVTVKNLLRRGVWKDFESEIKENISKALTHIETLGNCYEVNIDNWDILKIFGKDEPEKNGIYTRVDILNKRFAEEFKKHTQEKPDMEEIRKKITGNSSMVDYHKTNFFRNSGGLVSLETSLGNYRRNLTSYRNHVTTTISNIRKTLEDIETAKITASKEKDLSWLEGIEKILGENFWEIGSSYRDFISIRTKRPVYLKYKNPSAGLDFTVNMGYFTLEIRIGNTSISLYPYKDNIEVDNIHHPHFDSGAPCLGNAEGQYHNALEAKDSYKAIRILQALLTTYNHANPYKPLGAFYLVKNGKCPKCEAIEGECSCADNRCDTCDRDEQACNCYSCTDCDERIQSDDTYFDSSGDDPYCEGCYPGDGE
jgi:hypothetical protein